MFLLVYDYNAIKKKKKHVHRQLGKELNVRHFGGRKYLYRETRLLTKRPYFQQRHVLKTSNVYILNTKLKRNTSTK